MTASSDKALRQLRMAGDCNRCQTAAEKLSASGRLGRTDGINRSRVLWRKEVPDVSQYDFALFSRDGEQSFVQSAE